MKEPIVKNMKEITALAGLILLIILISGCLDQYSLEECNSNCVLNGYVEGSCLWPSEASSDMVDIGDCLIEQSRHCGNPGQCHCFCSKEIEKPEDTLSVSELLENPVYDEEVKIYGKVSLLGELLCPCFQLTSGGKFVEVWYDLMVETDTENLVCCEIYGLGAYMEKVNIQYEWTTPEDCTIPEGFVGGGREVVEDENCSSVPKGQWPSVSVEGIENSDWVVVSGELRSSTGTEPSTTFWATSIEKIAR